MGYQWGLNGIYNQYDINIWVCLKMEEPPTLMAMLIVKLWNTMKHTNANTNGSNGAPNFQTNPSVEASNMFRLIRWLDWHRNIHDMA